MMHWLLSILSELSAVGTYGGSVWPCCCVARPAASDKRVPRRSRTAGRSPGRGYPCVCAWCTPGPPSAPACRSATRSGVHSRNPPHSRMTSGRYRHLDLDKHSNMKDHIKITFITSQIHSQSFLHTLLCNM